MRRAQLVRVGGVGVDADILVPGFVLGHNAVQLGVQHRHGAAAVGLGGLFKGDVQHRADDIVRAGLGVGKVAQAVRHKGLVAVCPCQPFGVLGHMGVGADDKVNALIRQPLGGVLLEIIHRVAALGTHMAADDQHIAVRAHIGDLLGNRFAVA